MTGGFPRLTLPVSAAYDSARATVLEEAMKRTNAVLAVLIAALCIAATGCVTIESSKVGERGGPGAPISVSTSDYGFLHLSAPTGLTQTAQSNLMAQCATGKVSGVTTELSMREFLIVQYYTDTVSGVCQQ
jgi:hypothetical protein